jgi:hypothetical protein
MVVIIVLMSCNKINRVNSRNYGQGLDKKDTTKEIHIAWDSKNNKKSKAFNFVAAFQIIRFLGIKDSGIYINYSWQSPNNSGLSIDNKSQLELVEYRTLDLTPKVHIDKKLNGFHISNRDDIGFIYRIQGNNSSQKIFDIKRLNIYSIHADLAIIDCTQDVDLSLYSTNLNYLLIRSYADSFGNDYPSVQIRAPVIYRGTRGAANINSSVKHVNLETITVEQVSSQQIEELSISNSYLTDTCILKCDSASSFTFNDVRFKSLTGTLKLANAKLNAILKLRKVDVSKFDFDYSHFHFLPCDVNGYTDKNEWYSDVTSIYQNIISSQKRLNNFEGVKSATIELAKFEDQQSTLGFIVTPVKAWWNNYGTEKSKVVRSSFELFLIFFLLNLIWFKKILENYDVAGIKEVKNEVDRFTSRNKRVSRNVILCLIYTGVIFYGVKFDFKDLKIKLLPIVFLLFVEYILGLIALAYIANLIISK